MLRPYVCAVLSSMVSGYYTIFVLSTRPIAPEYLMNLVAALGLIMILLPFGLTYVGRHLLADEIQRLHARWSLSALLGDTVLADLTEEFKVRAAADPIFARLWLVRQLVGSFVVIHVFDRIRKAVAPRRSA